MAGLDIDRDRLTIFRTGNEYLFSHYFERADIFEALSEYYNDEEYRFEVPASDFEDVRERLEAAYFEPRVISDLEPYCVVIEKYEEHAGILKSAVATWERKGHRFFLLEDELAVADALDRGATRVSETEFVVGI